jgi:uncharacterized repeat protein (TIGR02543 family)
MSAFGNGSNSNGNFWYGNSTNFPGFLYKKNVGVGGRRSTKMGPGGNITCNSATDLYNKYKPGGGGVGASSIANRRAKNRLATVCGSTNKCFPCYNSLGQYSNYTHNPNGFVPCPGTINIISSSSSPTPTPPPPPSGTYTVTYLGNTNTSGFAPIDGNSPYNSGTSVTILGNSGSPVLAKSGFQFGGWNTAADGSGTNYVGGNTFNITQNTTLYAQWLIPGSPRLIYNANPTSGGTGTAPSSSNTSYPPYSSVDVVNNTFTNTNGYTFGGWNTVADGSGTYYPAGSEISMPALGPVTLFAQWINTATTYTLTYDSGTGGSGTPPASPTTYSSNALATILGNTGPYTNSDPTKIFYGWNTAADGTGTSYPAGSTITMNSDKTLYAQWGNSPLVTVTYDANGATGGSVPAVPTNYPSGVQVPILGQGSITKPGYTFLGWNSAASGNGSIYAPGFTFTSKTATLYANWAPGSPVKYCGGGDQGGTVGTPPVTIKYYFPIAQIILSTSTNTITVYTTALLSATASNYGTGTAPLGITSIASKTVITSTNITINTNTSYLNPVNDNNYTKTITNGVDSNYWPSGASISNITYSAVDEMNSSIPTYNTSTKLCFSSGCGLSANIGSNGSVVTSYSFYNQAFTINFSIGPSTFIANSPTNTLYTASTTSPVNWVTAPKDRYPYQDIQDSYNALTAITIIPSGGSTYVSPSMPATTVQYNGNGATGGSIPNPQYFGTYTGGTPTSVTISGNTGSGTSGPLTKSTAPNTFSRWNTEANGSGTNYGPGYTTTYNNTSGNAILYAIWV